MAQKRTHPEDAAASNDSKRSRSNEASPAAGVAAAKPSIQEQIAAAKARAAALTAARSGQSITSASAAATPSTPIPTATQSPAEAARAKIEAMKARVAAATAKSSAAPPVRSAPPPQTYQPPPPPPPQEIEEPVSRARGGLGIGLHPALLGDLTNDARTRGKAMPPKFATTMANRRAESPLSRPSSSTGRPQKQLDLSGPSLDEVKANPYFDKSLSNAAALPKARKTRELMFNEKGKYMAQAAALRRQAHLEDMKRRIAESARRAGLDEDRSEQAFLVAAPPDVEWWDEGLVTGTAYPNFSAPGAEAEKALKITTDDTVITRYVQHPVLLTPPQEKLLTTPKPMYMTKEEQRKKRRQDRSEVLKEKQAKVRLGLEPPEPPKIKKSNLMRVLGEQAVKDPTAVEARVNREIAERRTRHEEDNEARKLTKEQRAEKLAANQQHDAERGILVHAYRIDSLAYGKHRYRVDINAKQNGLTGITILHPKFCLVIVEGGARSMQNYQKLMLQRTDWTENGYPTEKEVERKPRPASAGPDPMAAAWLQPQDEAGELRDQSGNRCVLLWAGEEKARAFKKWGSRVCETEGEAQDVLKRAKMENMWVLAKNLPLAA